MIWIPITYGFNRMALRTTPHATMDILHERFEGMVISRGGDVNWPELRSCDLTPLDFFLWGYLKSQVYTNKPQTIESTWLSKSTWQMLSSKFSQIYARKSSKIGSPEYVSLSEAAADIWVTLYSLLNAIKCSFK